MSNDMYDIIGKLNGLTSKQVLTESEEAVKEVDSRVDSRVDTIASKLEEIWANDDADDVDGNVATNKPKPKPKQDNVWSKLKGEEPEAKEPEFQPTAQNPDNAAAKARKFAAGFLEEGYVDNGEQWASYGTPAGLEELMNKSGYLTNSNDFETRQVTYLGKDSDSNHRYAYWGYDNINATWLASIFYYNPESGHGDFLWDNNMDDTASKDQAKAKYDSFVAPAPAMQGEPEEFVVEESIHLPYYLQDVDYAVMRDAAYALKEGEDFYVLRKKYPWLQKMYDDISLEVELHPDDDGDEILDMMLEQLGDYLHAAGFEWPSEIPEAGRLYETEPLSIEGKIWGYDFTGDDGETTMGTLNYKASMVDGEIVIDPNSFYATDIDDINIARIAGAGATADLQPGQMEHEEAMWNAQDDAVDEFAKQQTIAESPDRQQGIEHAIASGGDTPQNRAALQQARAAASKKMQDKMSAKQNAKPKKKPGGLPGDGVTHDASKMDTSAGPEDMWEGEEAATIVNGKEVNMQSLEIEGVDSMDHPDYVDAYWSEGSYTDGTQMSEFDLDELREKYPELMYDAINDAMAGAADMQRDAAKYDGINEEVSMNITANGEEDVASLMQKLAGMNAELPIPADMPEAPTSMGMSDLIQAMPADVEDVPCDDCAGADDIEIEIEEERDIQHANTPHEVTAPVSAAIPAGDDMHKSKVQDPATANRAANPLKAKRQMQESVKEEDLSSFASSAYSTIKEIIEYHRTSGNVEKYDLYKLGSLSYAIDDLSDEEYPTAQGILDSVEDVGNHIDKMLKQSGYEFGEDYYDGGTLPVELDHAQLNNALSGVLKLAQASHIKLIEPPAPKKRKRKSKKRKVNETQALWNDYKKQIHGVKK
jgi:hypothetical protein